MKKTERFQARLTEAEKKSVGESDQKFMNMCMKLNKLGLLKAMAKQVEKNEKILEKRNKKALFDSFKIV